MSKFSLVQWWFRSVLSLWGYSQGQGHGWQPLVQKLDWWSAVLGPNRVQSAQAGSVKQMLFPDFCFWKQLFIASVIGNSGLGRVRSWFLMVKLSFWQGLWNLLACVKFQFAMMNRIWTLREKKCGKDDYFYPNSHLFLKSGEGRKSFSNSSSTRYKNVLFITSMSPCYLSSDETFDTRIGTMGNQMPS